MSKASTFLILALLLCATLSCATRPLPLEDTLVKAQTKEGEITRHEKVGENCEENGEEECLMRRTLAAHLDYIYTQKLNP